MSKRDQNALFSAADGDSSVVFYQKMMLAIPIAHKTEIAIIDSQVMALVGSNVFVLAVIAVDAIE